MGGAIAADAEAKIAGLPSVARASVEVVFEPPWNPNMDVGGGEARARLESIAAVRPSR